ncbi:PilC/PilY family type IV pilus protein [Neisseria sp. Ec49-e6-T10]|uniref:PilC/PilY family type IV pilus protein n=1 Tax=Neisseria sp. Ec49-e6-T10 TaxID=3140744 RepID=UPI003EBD023A
MKKTKLGRHGKKQYMHKSIIPLAVFLALTTSVSGVALGAPGTYPFPVYPIVSQPYINRTTPLLFAFVDNSTTMNNNASMSDNSGRNISRTKVPSAYRNQSWPTRLDVVKRGLHGMVEKYYDDFDWGLVVLVDQRRKDNWHAFSESDLGLYGATPIWNSDPNYSWMSSFPAERRANLIKNTGSNNNSAGTADIVASLPTIRYTDTSAKFFGKPMRFSPTDHSETNKATLLDEIRGIGITESASYMEDTFPQLLNVEWRSYATGRRGSYRDMLSIPDFVKYRCQDIFAVVFTDGNRVANAKNYNPTINGATIHPMSSSQLDGDGKPYNGTDFPNQYISTSAVGLDSATAGRTREFETFAQRGNGEFVLSEDADELGQWFEEFIEKRRPKYYFSASAPAVTYVMDDTGKQLAVSLQMEPNRWLSFLKINYLNSKNQVVAPTNVSAKYDYKQHTVLGSSAKSKGNWVNLSTASVTSLSTHFDNNSFGSTASNSDDFAKHYIPWLATSTQTDGETGYRNREVALAGVSGAGKGQDNEHRYLGDVLNTNAFMVGHVSSALNIPEYMVFGSNDGMVKVYQATNDSSKPFSYKLGMIPGMMPRDDHQTLYKAMYHRALPGYAIRDDNPHVFGVNGGIASRHTNKDHLFAVATMGQGGRGVFALNIAGKKEDTQEVIGMSAEQHKWAQSVPLWESSSLADLNDNLGYTVGNPIIGPVALKRDNKTGWPKYDDVYQAAFVANGYDGPKQENALLVVDALGVNIGESSNNTAPGDLLKKVDIQSILTSHYGLSAPALIDIDYDGIADLAYAGDRNGDLYRIDLRYPAVDQWKMVKIYSGSAKKPIVSAPAFSRYKDKPVVTFTTGSAIYAEDLKLESEQSIYGVFDDLKNMNPIAATETDLLEQTIDQSTKGYVNGEKTQRTLRLLSNKKPQSTHKGWKIDLPTYTRSGKFGNEQANASISVVDGTVVLSTTWLRQDAFADLDSGVQVKCFRDETEREGSIMLINALTGGALTKRDTHMLAKVDGKDVVINGYLTNGLTSPALVYSNQTYFMNNDGQFGLYNGAPSEKGLNTNLQIFPEYGYCKDDSCRAKVKSFFTYCKKKSDTREVSIAYTEGDSTGSMGLNLCPTDQIARRISWRLIG